jgi:hypothetical protein
LVAVVPDDVAHNPGTKVSHRRAPHPAIGQLIPADYVRPAVLVQRADDSSTGMSASNSGTVRPSGSCSAPKKIILNFITSPVRSSVRLTEPAFIVRAETCMAQEGPYSQLWPESISCRVCQVCRVLEGG